MSVGAAEALPDRPVRGRSSGFIGDRLAAGSTMNDFAADDLAFLLGAAGTLWIWRP